MMTPEKCIVMLVSQIVENQGKELKVEKWYGTKWYKEKIHDDFIAKLRNIAPTADEILNYPPENKYIP